MSKRIFLHPDDVTVIRNDHDQTIAYVYDQPERAETDTMRWARICREEWTGAQWDPRLKQIIAEGPDAQK